MDEASDPSHVGELANLIQSSVMNIDRNDLVKLLTKVKQNPSIVKTALKSIYYALILFLRFFLVVKGFDNFIYFALLKAFAFQ